MAAAKSDSQKNFVKFANQLRSTALGVKFGKKLFTDPTSLQPKQITQVLQSLGMNVPQDLVVTAEVAQVLISGQAISTGYTTLDNAKSAAEIAKAGKEINSATNATGAGIKALTYFGEEQKLLDSDSASVVRIGTSIGMIVCSVGTNVAAWIGLAMELASIGGSKQAQADAQAIQNAQYLYRNLVGPQAKILGETFKDFQEKKISIYGVIAKMAVETPDLWPQVITPDSPFVQAFPSLSMLPVVQGGVTGYGNAEISGNYPWPGKGRYVIASWDSHRTINFSTLGTSFNKETSAEYFFETLLKPWVISYAIANDEVVSRGNMSMENIAALSYLVNPSGEISDTQDYVKFLIGSCLTPYDFDDPILENISKEFVERAYEGQDKSFHEQAISFGLSEQNKTFVKYSQDTEIMRRKLELVQQSDDITELVQYEFIYKKLRSYMDFDKTSFERDPTLGGKLNEKFPVQSVRAWRQLHNYISVMNMIDTFRTDSYLSTTQFAQRLLPFFPSVDSFGKKIDKISYLSTARSVNRLAMSNIAGFLGVAPKDLVKVNKDELGAAKFTVK